MADSPNNNDSSNDRKNDDIIFVLGGPGTGKGTVCARLSVEFQMPHLSMGDLLRDEVRTASDLGKEIQAIIDGGNIVPSRITVKLLRVAIEKARENKGVRGVLVDGFPRSMEQVQAWHDQMGGFGFVLYLACDDHEVLVQRILKRGASGTSDRTDDDEPTVRRRLKVNDEQCEPCVQFYRQQKLVEDVNANCSADEEYQACRILIAAHLTKHKL